MENESEIYTTVSIRIFAPGLIPEDITNNLQIRPDHAHLEGDYPKSNPKYSVYKHGMWSLESKISEKESLEDHLESLLSILEPKWSLIRHITQDATVDFYCVLYSQSAFQLSPQIMKRIGEMGIKFGVVLYD